MHYPTSGYIQFKEVKILWKLGVGGRITRTPDFLHFVKILLEKYSSCSMLKIFLKYLNFENISNKCIRVPGPLVN